LLELALTREPTLATGRLICIDGPAGSGKTTLADGISARAGPGVRVIHMDDLYPGWSGLSEIDRQLGDLLPPLAHGSAGCYRRYDWVAGEYAETVVVEPAPVLVTLLVWVEAPLDERLRRGIERDGDAFAPHWEQWAKDESALFARERTRERADVVVDGTRPLG